MRSTELSANWFFSAPEEEPPFPAHFIPKIARCPATVPGFIHVDLMANGFIPDPFKNCFERDVSWVDTSPWIYKTEFDWQPNADLPRRVLRFEGLDTVCRVVVNGGEPVSSNNMFLPLEIDVTDRLEKGTNQIEVFFDSAIYAGRERREAYFKAEGIKHDTPNFEDRAFLRKAQYMYGWDWGPRLVSCGIWKPVHLLEYRNRIKQASFMQEKLADGTFRVWVEADIEGDAKSSAEIAGIKRAAGEPLEFILQPDLWWPNGEGPQTLHRASISVGDHKIEKRIGLRTIKLVQEEDKVGRSFEFEVNGRPVWARGANWIPNDSFVSRDKSVGSQIDVCRSLGMNMLRVWGGGFYESEDFYDACDRNGIMVWQDFPFACSYYPDGPAEQEVIKAEASSQVKRLRDRTSLAIWCGNNENLAMYEQSWGGKENRPSRYYGENIYNQTLPAVLKEFDPGRPYIPTSPLDPTKDNIGDAHYWDVWHGRGDWKYYEESKSRFASEFGFASSCSLECWRGVTENNDLPPHNVSRWHDKTGKTEPIFTGFVELHYPKSESPEDWTYYSQLNQRDAFRCGIEHFRRSPACRGSLIWQFNDCWPVQSWAVQDYRRLLKPAGFELRRVHEPVLVSIEIKEDQVHIHVANDNPNPLHGDLTLQFISTLDGSLTSGGHTVVELASNERKVCVTQPISGFEKTTTAVKAYLVGQEHNANWQLLAEPKETKFGKPEIIVDVKGDRLIVTVKGFVRDLVVWDSDDAYDVYDLRTGQPGWHAVTLANEETTFGLRHQPKELHGRSLGGSLVLWQGG
ncbi:MAG TPA: hypothetical protein VGL56_18475 [Fimbriimonadaceae bacterium]